MIFDYPEPKVDRLHDPQGYTSYESYRPWLRDDFKFRCCYCLKREKWGQVTGDFEIEHFSPQSIAPGRLLDYSNLVYSCRRCNAIKLDQVVADSLTVLSAVEVGLSADGNLVTNNVESRRLIMQLDLNSPLLVRWRVMWMRIVDLARERDQSLYIQLVSYPDDLPNLRKLRPPSNSKPESIEMSCYELRIRGLLPAEY